MYHFEKHTLGNWLNVYVATPKKGETHLKVFSTPTKPSEQPTLNIYAKGDFEFSVGSFTQQLKTGQSNLDLLVSELPAGILAVERALSDGALRMCVSPADSKTTWIRRAVTLKEGQGVTANDGFVILPLEAVEPLTSYRAPHTMTVYVAERILQ